MAKSLVVIQMEFRKAKEQADRLEQVARELTQLSCIQLDDTLSEINSAWKSDTSNAFIRKGRRMQEQLNIRANEIKRTAAAIRTIANNTYKAEMQAYQIATERKYKG